jgi:hypothetical protein
MRRHATVLILGFLALAALAGLAGWGVFAAATAGDPLRSLATVWPYVVGGAVAVAVFGAAFIALAVHAASTGFDERIEPD